MYEIDSRFRNADGSFRLEAAIEAGRKERAAMLGAGWRAIRLVLQRLRSGPPARAALDLVCTRGRPRNPRTEAPIG